MPTDALRLSQLLVVGRPTDHVVCRDGDRVIRWREFAESVSALAGCLAGRPEKQWAVACNNPLHFAVALFGSWHAGVRPVLPPNFQPGTLERMRHAIDGVLSDGESERALPTLDVRSSRGSRGPLVPIQESAGLDLYTSGSTSEPKLVPKSLAQLEAEVAAQAFLWRAQLRGATFVATVPHHHIYGLLFRLLLPLAAGRPFDTALCSDPGILLERLSAAENAIVVSSPALLSRLPDLVALEHLAPAARLILSSGGPLPTAAAAAFRRQLGRAPTEIYGSTETGGIAWRRQEEDAAWTLLPEVEARADGGALCLRSPFLPDENWLTLEDAAEFLPDGRFLLKGRLDRVIKIEEKRLSLPDMEERLRAHPWVADAGLVALPARAGRRQSLGAAIALSAPGRERLAAGGRRELARTLREHLATWFEPVLLPRRWRFPPALPVNERGKLTVEALAALFHEDAPKHADPAA